MSLKKKKWFNPMFEFEDKPRTSNKVSNNDKKPKQSPLKDLHENSNEKPFINSITDHKSWMKNFDPKTVEDLAVHNKKVQEVEEWLKLVCDGNNSNMLLLSGPVGCGKTATIRILAKKININIGEWITPLDIDFVKANGDYEYKSKQSSKFIEFLLQAANFTSLLDNNGRKLVLVEDMPNTFSRTPSEFADVLEEYKHRAKSPIVFICSESYTDNKNSSLNLFNASIKEKYGIQHITFNSVSPTGLKAALKRVVDIISKKYPHIYNVPKADLIECVVNSSAGDVRSAVLNLHFACLKGSNQNLETSLIEKEPKANRKRKAASSKFTSIGKDQTVSILHGVGRVLNPKVTIENGHKKLTHSPEDIIEQFTSQPGSFVNFIAENYLPHFSAADYAAKAASALSDADYLLAEWREKMCQEYGLYVATAGLMLANVKPISAWNPVRGPKNTNIQYPTPHELNLEDNNLYKGKVLVTDYQTYCKIIGESKT